MEPTSEDPETTPESASTQVPEQVPEPAPTPPSAPVDAKKKGKKPLIITLVSLVILVAAGCAGWFWWSGQQLSSTDSASDLPANNSQQQKVLEPHTVAYSYNASDFQSPSDLFWRSADGGERQNVPSKAFVGSSRINGNQLLIETYYSEAGKTAPSVLYSADGGKTYETIFTGKAPATSTDMGDQITGMVFASDGKSVIFAVLPNNSKNTVKRIFFDKPTEVIDIMTSDARGVFPIAFNAKLQKLIFSEGCYNCDGNGASTSAFAYDVVSKQRTTLIDGADKHLGILSNKSASSLLITTPTIDKAKTGGEDGGFWGYYVGAPYTFSILNVVTGKTQDPGTTVGTAADNKFVRGGFMTDDTTPYYYSGNQLFMLDKATPTLLYEAGQPIHEVFYVSPTTVFASTGDHQNFTLNRFGIKTQETKQLLTGDDTTTRIFGITEH